MERLQHNTHSLHRVRGIFNEGARWTRRRLARNPESGDDSALVILAFGLVEEVGPGLSGDRRAEDAGTGFQRSGRYGSDGRYA